MVGQCVVCPKKGIYKCPTCRVYYCSAGCCGKHREGGCAVLEKPVEATGTSGNGGQLYATADTVPLDQLELLKGDETVKDLLKNKHLRDYLRQLDDAVDPERAMEMAMHEPIFVEFAEACLKVVEPPDTDDP